MRFDVYAGDLHDAWHEPLARGGLAPDAVRELAKLGYHDARLNQGAPCDGRVYRADTSVIAINTNHHEYYNWHLTSDIAAQEMVLTPLSHR